VNGDGLPDIVVANRTENGPGANYVCPNRGNGKFDADCIAFSHESATTIAPADFNNDGYIDLAVPNRDGGQSYLYLNDGKANFLTRVAAGEIIARLVGRTKGSPVSAGPFSLTGQTRQQR
jgi:FG-GAP-like repeat